MARGELIASCDDDALWHTDKLTEHAALLRCEPDLLVVGSGIRLLFPGDRIVQWPGRPTVGDVRQDSPAFPRAPKRFHDALEEITLMVILREPASRAFPVRKVLYRRLGDDTPHLTPSTLRMSANSSPTRCVRSKPAMAPVAVAALGLHRTPAP